MNMDVFKQYGPPDHVCYRTETIEEYNELVDALKGPGTSSGKVELLIEGCIGGRSIATFRLLAQGGVMTKHGLVNVVEIPAPKEGSPYKSGLEHAEFVIGAHHGVA
eukprot:CAMPEP_0195533180 /NCGR_PEP_ID=MMETSP0794_2-20130614/39980_1 /TAXON_ID=515487 /ORGANISM="Stephanopyxis turris, Strain CCMP 815" /LENGTH=105 /DNA_ID=CAMNT_0040665627 /DNA_START=129 /DNA_END=443 /DNA_ORIENTATION=-